MGTITIRWERNVNVSQKKKIEPLLGAVGTTSGAEGGVSVVGSVGGVGSVSGSVVGSVGGNVGGGTVGGGIVGGGTVGGLVVTSPHITGGSRQELEGVSNCNPLGQVERRL